MLIVFYAIASRYVHTHMYMCAHIHTTTHPPTHTHARTHVHTQIAYSESLLGIGTGTSSAKYSTDGSIVGNNSGASLENIISLEYFMIYTQNTMNGIL